jgi:hypothetical protein
MLSQLYLYLYSMGVPLVVAPQVFEDQLESFLVLNAGAVFVARFFQPSASSAMNSRTLPSYMLILMTALKQHKTYATRRLSTFTAMEKELTRCLVQGRRDFMIAFGCILDGYLSDSEWLFCPWFS